MRRRNPTLGTKMTLVGIAALLVMGAFAGPATAAHRTVFITTDEVFEEHDAPLTGNCSSGTFVASGVFSGSGNARSCVRKSWTPGINTGTTELHNSDDLSPSWKVQCNFDGDDRIRQRECTGQWSVNGPNWQGGGNARVLFDFVAGTAEWTFNGKLTHT